MDELTTAIDRVAAEIDFSGAVRVDRPGQPMIARAYGFAHRAHQIANTVETRFGVASAVKGLTALVVVSLIEDGTLQLSTTARSLLGDDLPLIDDAVTIEHLLAHRSGIGDYLDEEAPGRHITDYAMTRPVHELLTTEDYVVMLDGFPQQTPPGERFAYNNGAFVVLALLAERASGVPFHDLVRQRVCEPAGMVDSEFLRSDELPAGVAMGYLPIEGVSRTNVFHLPVLGTGDGGIYTTLADVHSMWAALFEGRIVSKAWVAEMVRPRSDAPEDEKRYGLGFWLHQTSDAVILTGYDAGVSFRSVHDPTTAITFTVISNTSEGAWPMARLIVDELQGQRDC
jgi:CubicO group peptidase (beta-lactamase class C family)